MTKSVSDMEVTLRATVTDHSAAVGRLTAAATDRLFAAGQIEAPQAELVMLAAESEALMDVHRTYKKWLDAYMVLLSARAEDAMRRSRQVEATNAQRLQATGVTTAGGASLAPGAACPKCGHEIGEHTPGGCEIGINGPGRMCGCTSVTST